MSTDRAKVQSPHPALQSVLSRLASLNPAHTQKQVFDSREEAEEYIEEQPRDLHLNAVWAIDHSDLEASQITAWSFTEYPC